MMTRRRITDIVFLLAPALLIGGCTTTTIDCQSLPVGQEIVLRVESWRSPVRVTNNGPGEVIVTADWEGRHPESSQRLGVGATDVPVRRKLTLTVSNLADDGPEAVGVRLEIKDPAAFTLDQRPVAAPAGSGDTR